MALTTVPDKATGDTFTEENWDTHIKDNINGLIGLTTSPNLLVNPGFDIWQRGAGPHSGSLTYGADRWQMQASGAQTIATQRDAATKDDLSVYALRATVGGSGGNTLIRQVVESPERYAGQAVTFSVRVRTTIAGVTLGLTSGPSTTSNASDAHPGDDTWQTLSVTHTLVAGATWLWADVTFGAVNGLSYVDNATLVLGSVAAPWAPPHPADDLERCLRYFEVHGGIASVLAMSGYAAAAGAMQQIVTFAVPKGGTPTLTKNGTWAVTNCGQPAASGATAAGYSFGAVVTALGGASFSTNSTDDAVTAEWNP